MKKITTTFLLVLYMTVSFAQTKTSSKLGTSSRLSKNDSIMCSKVWKISSLERDGTRIKLKETKSKNDMLSMALDHSFTAVLEGVKKEGKWSRSGQYIYFTEPNEEKFNYKILVVEPGRLKIEYAKEESKLVFELEPKK
ncbi:MAG TPA: hypothetical protein VF868_15600 [Bacteroidia bacterium]|jgi:hypothetical protein